VWSEVEHAETGKDGLENKIRLGPILIDAFLWHGMPFCHIWHAMHSNSAIVMPCCHIYGMARIARKTHGNAISWQLLF